jgi:hypothetical protein
MWNRPDSLTYRGGRRTVFKISSCKIVRLLPCNCNHKEINFSLRTGKLRYHTMMTKWLLKLKSHMSTNGNDSSISGKADDADGNI